VKKGRKRNEKRKMTRKMKTAQIRSGRFARAMEIASRRGTDSRSF